MSNNHTDLFIIGGGINGTGIALDAAGRGLSVRLCEQHDLASETSSYSSKLIHGGLRYLEFYEFSLVRKALKEREVLMNLAPHLIHPLRLVMPHNSAQRPRWMVRLGLFLYDHLNLAQSLPKSHGLKINSQNPDQPLNDKTHFAYEYSDCTVDDARYVVHLALAAQERGADILTRHRVEKIERRDNDFAITVTHQAETKSFYAKAIVNAAGPWVDQVVAKADAQSKHHIRLIKGSHLVTKKLYDGDQAYLLQNSDNRIVFVIPYRDEFTLIGTTDVAYQGDPHTVAIDEDEQCYMLDAVNQYFKKQLTNQDIVWTYAGVRPLQSDEHDDPSKVTRDYMFEIDEQNNLPMLSVFGGKITTYRVLSEQAVDKLKPYFKQMKNAWTDHGKLPGSDFTSFEQLIMQLLDNYTFLDQRQAHRIAYAYGQRAFLWLKEAQLYSDLGQDFGHGLSEAEVRFLIDHEWAQTAEDILQRRSKMVLRFTTEETKFLTFFLQNI